MGTAPVSADQRNGARYPRSRPGLEVDTFAAPADDGSGIRLKTPTARPSTGNVSRPQSKRAEVPPMPGQLPPTPGASEGEEEEGEAKA